MKKQCNLYLSERAIQMANEIAEFETLPRAAIFEEAIRRYHKSFKMRQMSSQTISVDDIVKVEQTGEAQ